jgi:hypothetical protein
MIHFVTGILVGGSLGAIIMGALVAQTRPYYRVTRSHRLSTAR